MCVCVCKNHIENRKCSQFSEKNSKLQKKSEEQAQKYD